MVSFNRYKLPKGSGTLVALPRCSDSYVAQTGSCRWKNRGPVSVAPRYTAAAPHPATTSHGSIGTCRSI